MRKEASKRGAETLKGADGISLSLLCGIHDGEIEEPFWREGEKQKAQDAKGADSDAYWVAQSPSILYRLHMYLFGQ